MMTGSSLRLKERLGLSGPVRDEAQRSEVERVVGSMKPSVRVAPDPEVSSMSGRRRFSAAYKARIVLEADACTESGEVGALLRREGLYSSSLSHWRKEYRKAGEAALADDKRGRKVTKNPLLRGKFEAQLLSLAKPYLSTKNAPQHTLAKRIDNFLDELFTFVQYPQIPSENNAAQAPFDRL